MNPINQLTAQLSDQKLSQQDLIRAICHTIEELIPNANLISLWVFDDTRDSIRSLVNYDTVTKEFTEGIVLRQKDYPPYFRAITEEELVVASDARNHSATRCFNESYFEPLKIHSLLDFILHKDFQANGVICCESKGSKVQWTGQDIEHIRMIASLISFCFDLSSVR